MFKVKSVLFLFHWGINRTPIYRIKMQPGELISNDLVVELYEQRIY